MKSLITLAVVLVLMAAGVVPGFGQATDGVLVGVVSDQTGGVIPNATLELQNQATGVKVTTTTSASGAYRFNNVPVGLYTITGRAGGFTEAGLKNVQVELNKTGTANLTLQVGTVATTLEVSESSTLIDTTTSQVGSTFEARQSVDLPLANQPLGVLNLSLLSAGVGSSGGYGLGEGPSIGGQRPRNNYFAIEGVDNNRKDVTGHNVNVPNEAVESFTILQNQFSAEFGQSNGGQFNTVIRGGTNEIHGSGFEYLQNKKLNANDENLARQGIGCSAPSCQTKPRYDQNEFGGAIGGPIIKNKLFAYGLYEYNPIGQAPSPSSATFAPTAAGYATLSGLSGISQTNLGVMKQYLPPAPSASDTVKVNGATIPIGAFPINAPNFQNNTNWLVSVDYNISARDSLRARYISNKRTGFSPEALSTLPSFYTQRPITGKLFTLSEYHTFGPHLTNEFRANYNRYNDSIPSGPTDYYGRGDFTFPGLDMFPNITIADMSLQLGPYDQGPSSTILNTYQAVDNMIWTKGRNTVKFGGDFHKYIAPQNFIQRVRGDYGYGTLQQYLNDLTPDELAERNIGGVPYSGNQINFYWFVNDEFHLRRNLTVNVGVRYEYKGITASDKLHSLNALSNVPGLITFKAPEAQKRNFAPRLGIAYSPGRSGLTSVRAGFGIGYDVLFDNFGLNATPPQISSTVDANITSNAPDFLKKGGIKSALGPTPTLSVAEARAATSAHLPDQLLPYSISWNLGVSHVWHRDYVFEVRYLGTKGVHLYTQNRLNIIAPVTATRNLPTYLQRPSQATLDSLPLTLDGLRAISNIKPEYDANGLNGNNIVEFTSRGNSTYHGLAMEATRRFSNSLMFKGAYTWSHSIDDSSADLFSTYIAPRRPQDFQDMTSEKSTSLLDHRQRFSFTWIYDTPWYRQNSNWFKKNLIGNYTLSGTYQVESAQFGTVQSGVDSNLNGDSAGDRTIINSSGNFSKGSGVTALTNSAGKTVGYLANDPSAGYIVAGVGAYPNGGRETLPLRGGNNWDVSVAKKFNVTERVKFEFRASFYNFFNHPQYTPGYVSNVQFSSKTDNRNNFLPNSPLFNRPDLAYLSHARQIWLAGRVTF